MTTFRGTYGLECAVTADGQPLDPRTDLEHYADTFYWGCDTREGRQLALAILAHELGDAAALELHGRFLDRVVFRLPFTDWQLTSEEVRAHNAPRPT